MEEFPSDVELTVASSLLILSCKFISHSTPSISEMEEFEDEQIELEFESELCEKSEQFETSTDTMSCVSSLSGDYSVQDRNRFSLIEEAARRNEFKLKVARKARSKVIYKSSINHKPASIIWKVHPTVNPKTAAFSEPKTDMTTTTTTSEGSCLSSGGSSEISSGRSRSGRVFRPEGRERKGRNGKMAMVERQLKRRGYGPSHLRRRADAIITLLSSGECASEVRIRQVLGDSPDTSKALRMLLRMEEVKRTGAGGRSDPYIYKIAAEIENRASLTLQQTIA